MPKPTRAETAAPCVTCPWLTENLGKPNPETFAAAQQRAGGVLTNWFAPANLERLWKNGLRHGDPMVCHKTDPEAVNYGGAKVAAGNERICIGALAIAFKHAKHYETLLKASGEEKPKEIYRIYKKAAGKFPMTLHGLANFIFTVSIGRTGLFGGLTIPKALASGIEKKISVPWQDSIVNGSEQNEK